MPAPDSEIEQLHAAMATLEAQRSILGDAVVDAALGSMRLQLAALEKEAAPIANEQQRKQATVLFADVVGFTTLSETMDAELVTELINALWTRIDRVVNAYGGRIDKHIGDAVMALWGTESAREDDPEQAVRAALAMQSEVDAYSESCRSLGRLPAGASLKMRVGINTGPVLLGQVGLTREYTAMGDTVNVAHRLEQSAPLGGVLVAHNSYRHIRGMFDIKPLGPIRMRGRNEMVPAYVVLRPKPHTFRATTRGVEGIVTRMIGRDDELAALQATFEEVLATGRMRMVTITGDAGVGKSRLLYEFENWIEQQPAKVSYFRGRATPALQSVPHSLWRDLLSFRFDILDSDSPAVALSKFRKGFSEESGGDGSANPIPHMTDIVGHWLGFDFSASPAVQRLAGGPDFAALAQTYFLRIARRMAQQRCVVVLLEDIHWADDSSLDLIQRLAESVTDAQVLIICLARPAFFDRRPNWGERLSGHREVRLTPLDTEASRALVLEILQRADSVPDTLRDLVVKEAEGNPFYIEELVKMLIEQGVIIREALTPGILDDDGYTAVEERWRIVEEKVGEIRVPSTLTALLQARIDGLSAEERAVLQRAAVVGRIFWDDAVLSLMEDEPLESDGGEKGPPIIDRVRLHGLLTRLTHREIIAHRPRPAFVGTEEFSFRHNLLREVAYETVLKRDRPRHHARVARWLEVNSGARLAENLGLIAEHYIMAGMDGRAAAYLERSGDASQHKGAYFSARDAFERALSLRSPDNTDATIELRLKLGIATWNLGDFPAAERSLFIARDLARRSGNARAQAVALYWLNRVAVSRGDYAQARMLLAYGLPLARAADPETLAQTLYGVADVAWRLGDMDTLQVYIVESLSLARAVGNTSLELMALSRIGNMAYVRGDFETARSYYETCLDLARLSGNVEREATALANLGTLAHRQGEISTGMEHYRSALAHYRELGRSEAVVMALGNLAEAAVELGELEAAWEAMREGLALAWRLGMPPRMLMILYVYGRYLRARGDPARGAAVMRLVLQHPAVENQMRALIEKMLIEWNCDLAGETVEIEAVVAEILGE